VFSTVGLENLRAMMCGASIPLSTLPRAVSFPFLSRLCRMNPTIQSGKSMQEPFLAGVFIVDKWFFMTGCHLASMKLTPFSVLPAFMAY
jgi:hypothetical protein